MVSLVAECAVLLCMAWWGRHGEFSLGTEWQGQVCCGEAWQVWLGPVVYVVVRYGAARCGRHGMARFCWERCGMLWQACCVKAVLGASWCVLAGRAR